MSRAAPGRALSSPETSFVGRERELAALAEVVAAERLVTLHGPGGAGKTRLALELMRRDSRAAPDVLLADLAPLSAGSSLWSELEQLAGARREPDEAAADAVARTLGDRPLLLVLDNCEHVLAVVEHEQQRPVAQRASDGIRRALVRLAPRSGELFQL